MLETNDDPFAEHIKIEKEMNNLRDELSLLCQQGNYDEAIRRAKDELVPMQDKWRESLIKAFANLKEHPNFYMTK